ncbi:MAG: ATP-binding protein, partial [Cyanobacteriota bacterium]
CVAINLIGGVDISSRKLLYLDMLGTALAGIALGPWWGASVGLVTNLLLYFMLPASPSLFIFALVNVFGGLYWGYMCNLKLLKPLEGVTSIQKIFSLNSLKDLSWFIIASGGIVLSLPVFYILKSVLGYIQPGTGFERYFYYIMTNISDKLLCVVIATVIIFAFFPALASHLISSKSQISYGVSARSIFWFCGIYFVPCCIYVYLYPQHIFFWLLPYILAVIASLKAAKEPKVLERNNVNIMSVSYGALYWLILISIATFGMFIYSAINNITSKYNVYHVDGVIKYSNIFADAFSLSLVVGLIGIVFVILIQAVKQRESREVVRRVEWARDKIATDIHNDPLQLVSVLRRKISTMENTIIKSIELLEEVKIEPENKETLSKLTKSITDLNKTFCNYYSIYLPELDTSIRKIIKPLSQKDSTDIIRVGLIQKFKDHIEEFKEKNESIKVKEILNITEDALPKRRSDNDNWKIEVIKIFREILNNVEKHSKATKLYIDLKSSMVKGKKKLFLSISDNGIGFDPKIVDINPNSFGLYEIQTRAKDIGATINIEYLYREKKEGKGTIVMLEIPYDY